MATRSVERSNQLNYQKLFREMQHERGQRTDESRRR